MTHTHDSAPAPEPRVDAAPWLIPLADGHRLVVIATRWELERFARDNEAVA